MISWNKLQQEMDHVAQFRNLSEQDWNYLCVKIQQEIIGEPPDNKVTKPSFLLAKTQHDDRRQSERRTGDRRQDDRRDYSKLRNVTDSEWEILCKKIRVLTDDERQKDERRRERRQNDRRKGHRRQDNHDRQDSLN